MVHFPAWKEHVDVACLPPPASPPSAFGSGHNGNKHKAVRARRALNLNHSVDGGPEDLDSADLQELEFALEWSAPELPEVLLPPTKRLREFIKVMGAQRPNPALWPGKLISVKCPPW